MNRNRSVVRVEALEDRLAPATVATVREAVGGAVEVLTARDQFRVDLGGGVVAGANGSFGGVRREINWDGTPDAKSSPNPLPGDFFNTTSPRGAVFQTPGAGFQVSATLASGQPVRFGNIDPTYPAEFAAFSPQRLFTPVGSTVTDVLFFVPGTATPAVVTGFGAVFADVDLASVSKLEFFDVRGRKIAEEDVPAVGGSGTFAFLGVTFTEAAVARVRITTGNTALAASVTDAPADGRDLVVLDDFLYGEPVRPVDRVVPVGAGEGTLGQVNVLQPDGTSFGTVTPFPGGFTGGVRVAAGDVNNDGVLDTVVGSGPGAATAVRVLDGRTQAVLFDTTPFEEAFTGGVFVASGDLNGDGFAEVIVTPDQGGGPRVRVFSGNGFNQLADFFGIEDPNFRGGARAAVGDLTSDGKGDLLVAAGFGGGPRLAGFEGASVAANAPVKPFADFFVFEQTLRNGVYVAAGDLNGDGFADVIAGGGPGGGPRIYAVDGKALIASVGASRIQVANFFATDDVNNRGGVRVAARDLNADGRSDIIAGDGPGAGARVRAFDSATLAADGRPPELYAVDAFADATNGVYVG
ncbi:MAG TPA: VCBS repeat-containing protein [Gemmataceae bacterium]|nr:VCBS repeat-containing protein [Gemmataceae bacterium]